MSGSEIPSTDNQPMAERDSLGSLVRPPSNKQSTSPSISTTKTASEILAEPMSVRHVLVALGKLDTIYGAKDMTPEDLKLRVTLWYDACRHLPPTVFLAAISDHIKNSQFFPKPSEIIDNSKASLDMLDSVSSKEARTKADALGGKVHEARLRPPKDPTFLLQMSHLRSNQNWQRFLNGIHPTAEHFYFVDCKMGQYEHELEGLSPFAKDYIHDHWAGELYEVFGRSVVLKLAPRKQDFARATMEKKTAPSPEASKRMSDLVKKFMNSVSTDDGTGN